MSYQTITTGISVFPASPASPHAFSILAHAQSPRDNHMLYDDVRVVFGSTNGRLPVPSQKERSRTSSLKGGLKKMLWAM